MYLRARLTLKSLHSIGRRFYTHLQADKSNLVPWGHVGSKRLYSLPNPVVSDDLPSRHPVTPWSPEQDSPVSYLGPLVVHLYTSREVCAQHNLSVSVEIIINSPVGFLIRPAGEIGFFARTLRSLAGSAPRRFRPPGISLGLSDLSIIFS